jgi:hypothetical protein
MLAATGVVTAVVGITLVMGVGTAHCADAAPLLRWSTSTLSGTSLLPGADRKLLFGARVDAVMRAPLGIEVLGRADASALSDGAAVNVNLLDPTSFSTLELYGGLTRPVIGPAPLTNEIPSETTIGPAFVYGAAFPIEAGRLAVVERHPRVWVLGGFARIGDAWILLGGGEHEATGRGARMIFAGEMPKGPRTAIGVDGAIGPHSMLRAYLLVRLAGSH